MFLNKCLHCNKLFQDQYVRNQFNREKHIKSNLTTVKKTAKKALLLESTRNSTQINKMFKEKIRTYNIQSTLCKTNELGPDILFAIESVRYIRKLSTMPWSIG